MSRVTAMMMLMTVGVEREREREREWGEKSEEQLACSLEKMTECKREKEMETFAQKEGGGS